jgi:hypothetical protein
MPPGKMGKPALLVGFEMAFIWVIYTALDCSDLKAK